MRSRLSRLLRPDWKNLKTDPTGLPVLVPVGPDYKKLLGFYCCDPSAIVVPACIAFEHATPNAETLRYDG